MKRRTLLAAAAPLVSCKRGVPAGPFDVLIKSGNVFDGSGSDPIEADVAITGDRIAAIGRFANAKAKLEIDARGLAVCPGFVNMLSWANESLLVDGRAQSDVRQGVTTELFGEGWSMGPWNDAQKELERSRQADLKWDIEWSSLREYLLHLEKRGVSVNVASLVGHGTVRAHVLGEEDVQPTEAQLAEMRRLVRVSMEEGAFGLGTALVYVPCEYATVEELIALSSEARFLATHMRSEGDELLEAIAETIRIARDSKARVEIYHLKASGRHNWDKLEHAIEAIANARAAGLPVAANMYCYDASATGLDVLLPAWAREGGIEKCVARLKDPAARKRAIEDVRTATQWRGTGPEGMLLIDLKSETLARFEGQRLSEVAKALGKDPAEAAVDLVVDDRYRIGTIYFSMSEANVSMGLGLPWVTLGSDEAATTNEGVFLKSGAHPRAYGNFARFLGRYVREKNVVPLAKAIRRMTAQPAANLKLDRRGRLEKDWFADVVVFDPASIKDHATYENPFQYATGVKHVFVNGGHVVADGDHTGAKPGRALRPR